MVSISRDGYRSGGQCHLASAGCHHPRCCCCPVFPCVVGDKCHQRRRLGVVKHEEGNNRAPRRGRRSRRRRRRNKKMGHPLCQLRWYCLGRISTSSVISTKGGKGREREGKGGNGRDGGHFSHSSLVFFFFRVSSCVFIALYLDLLLAQSGPVAGTVPPLLVTVVLGDCNSCQEMSSRCQRLPTLKNEL